MSSSTNLWNILPLDTIRAARPKGNKLLMLEYTLRQLICVHLQRERCGAAENINRTTPRVCSPMDTETSWTRNTCLMTDFPEALNRPDLIRLSVLKSSRRCQQRRSFYRNINDTFLWKHDFQGKGLNHKKNRAVKRLPALLLRQKMWNKVCWGFLTLFKSCYTVSWLEQLFRNED